MSAQASSVRPAARRRRSVNFSSSLRMPFGSQILAVQRFQLAMREAKVRIDFAISSGTWLMPSRMVLNTESAVGFNNKLMHTSNGMRLGVNSDVNLRTYSLGVHDMEGGPTKTHQPNIHPSNPIHQSTKKPPKSPLTAETSAIPDPLESC